MTIYALRIGDEAEWIDRIFNSLKDGEGRFAWSYVETADLRELQRRIDAGQWQQLTDDEQNCYQPFLLALQDGDYVVYINVPEWGMCTLAKVTGEYYWRWEDDDYNHRFPVDCRSVYSFNRNDAMVLGHLCARLKLQGRWWTIHAKDEFDRLLEALHKGTPPAPSTPEIRLQNLSEEVQPLLLKITKHIQHTHPNKDLESLIARVFERVPGVKGVTPQRGPSDQGADLVMECESGASSIPGLEKPEVIVVQIKSYEGVLRVPDAVNDIRRAFEKYPDASKGLIISTAESASDKFRHEFDRLQEETGKQVSLLIGTDLAKFFLKYGGDLLD